MAEWKKIILSGSTAELAAIVLDSALPVSSGGTGADTLTNGGLLLGSGTGPVTAMAVLADGAMIVGDGSGAPVPESGATLRTSIGIGVGDSPTFTNLNLNGFIINNSAVDASHITGSFTGSFIGDGSALTGLPSAAINTYSAAANNRIITSVDSNSVQGEANLTFDGSLLNITGGATLSGTLTANGDVVLGNASGDSVTINAQTINLANIAAGTDDTVVLWNGSTLVTDEIDSRVWGSSLIDGSGVNTRLAYFSDSNTLTTDSGMTFNGTSLSVNGSSFGSDVVIAGNLTILGDTMQQNVSNLLVEDKFILLNSGSATGDGGFIVQTESGFTGAAIGWDDSATRWSIQKSTKLSHAATAIAPEAYIAGVVDVDAGMSDISAFQQNGNIRVDSGDIFIYA